jgi:glycerophosphoryl diester phosphodiesterase
MRRIAWPCLLVFAALAAPASANPWLDRGPLNIAHQGGEHEVPSDTLYGFKTALPKGVDVLELDVHLTADGHVVALHDTTVDRTTNGSGTVEQMTLAQIKELDAAYWFVPDEGTTEGRAAEDYVFRGIATGEAPPPEGFEPNDFTIPTLDEVLTAFPGTLINIELKQSNSTGRFEMAVADLLRKHDRVEDVIVVSFLDHSLEVFKALAPDVHTATATVQAGLFWGSSQGPLPGAPNPRHVALQVPMNLVADVTTEDFVKNANANGLAVHVWTINDRETMEQLLDWGVQGIMTDRPTLLEEILQERGVALP